MAGITAMGTTYNLPNYTGLLYALTPTETPLFSAIGGLAGGGQTTNTQFEWEGYDLRVAGQNVQLEGATAPTAQNRVRQNIKNVTQIHQEKVSVSYSKQAAVGQKSGVNNALPNPIANELDWQTETMLKQMVRDVNWSFINGVQNIPADNTTKRQTAGLLSIMQTNVANAGTVLGTGLAVAASGDSITKTAHGLTAGQTVRFSSITGATPLVSSSVYYVSATNLAANTFSVGLTKGGPVVDITADGTATVTVGGGVTIDAVDNLLQSVFDNGGISDQATATLLVGSAQKRRLTKAYATTNQYREMSRNVGGLNLQTIETDFGTLNIMLDRMVPQDTVAVVSLEMLQPVYLEVPGMGHFFAEPLSKTGASNEVQLYGEVGLAYGNEHAHGVLSGLDAS